MARFDSAIALALRLIKKNGQLVKWRHVPDAAPTDVNKPWEGGVTVPVDYDVYICFVPIEERRDRVFFNYLDGTNVQIGALAGLMGTVAFEPSAKDVVIRGGKELRIKNLGKIAPNEQTVLWIPEFEQ